MNTGINAYTSTGPAVERAAAHREDRHTLFISSKQETVQGLGPCRDQGGNDYGTEHRDQ